MGRIKSIEQIAKEIEELKKGNGKIIYYTKVSVISQIRLLQKQQNNIGKPYSEHPNYEILVEMAKTLVELSKNMGKGIRFSGICDEIEKDILEQKG